MLELFGLNYGEHWPLRDRMTRTRLAEPRERPVWLSSTPSQTGVTSTDTAHATAPPGDIHNSSCESTPPRRSFGESHRVQYITLPIAENDVVVGQVRVDHHRDAQNANWGGPVERIVGRVDGLLDHVRRP